jgi:hypothetical protein
VTLVVKGMNEKEIEDIGFGVCIAFPGVFGAAFVLILGSLSLKNFRYHLLRYPSLLISHAHLTLVGLTDSIHVIFNSSNLLIRPPSDTRLLQRLSIMFVAELSLNFLWLAFDPATLVRESTSLGDGSFTYECHYNYACKDPSVLAAWSFQWLTFCCFA